MNNSSLKKLTTVGVIALAAACSDKTNDQAKATKESAEKQASAIKDQGEKQANALVDQANKKADALKEKSSEHAEAVEESGEKKAESIENRNQSAGTAGPMSKNEIRQAQVQLKDRGYLKGKVDGVMGPDTRQAVQAFQKAESLQVSGNFDSETRARLNQSAGEARD